MSSKAAAEILALCHLSYTPMSRGGTIRTCTTRSEFEVTDACRTMGKLIPQSSEASRFI